MRKNNCLAILCVLSMSVLHAQLPANPAASYPLDNTALDEITNHYDGTLASTAGTTNRFNVVNKATAFVSGSSNGALPKALITALQNDFTIGFWFKTTMVARSGSAWYSGNSLVDAEVCGAVNDWGIALINGGQVCIGVGPSDITITSPSQYNDGTWHFVTAVRNQAAGLIILYVDGTEVNRTTGTSTAALSSPPFLGLGVDPCNAPNYTGSLDDMVAYSRVLSTTEINNMYAYMQGITLPVQWMSFTGQHHAEAVNLNWTVAQSANTAYFDVEHSTDGFLFKKIATINASAVQADYSFTTANLSNDKNWFRIKQVDANGKGSYSTTIALTKKTGTGAIGLEKNLITNSLVLQNRSGETIKQLTVVDRVGQTMKQQVLNTSNGVITMDVSHLPAGYFFLQVQMATGSTQTIRFVKE